MAGLTAEQAYGLSQSEIKKVASGFDHAERTGDNTFSIFFVDGSKIDLTIPLPKDGEPGAKGDDGIGISKIEKIGTVDLVDTYRITFTDNSTFDYEVKNGNNGADGQPGQDGFSPTITENADNTDKIYKLDVTTADGTFTTPNLKGKDGSGSSTGEENVIESIKVNGVVQTVADDKSVDITVPTVDVDKNYVDTELAKKANTSDIPSLDGYAKTSEIPSKVSELENDSNYLSSIPGEYVTDTELDAKGYLTEHQDISNLVEKEDGKGLSSNDYTTEEKNKLAGLENYNDTALSNRVKSVEDEVPNLATKTYVGEQIANAEHLKREIVTVLPSDAEASDNIIYMLKVESATGNDKYKEYMKIDGTVQMVGDTSVDLTDYAKTVDIPTTVAQLTDNANYAKKTDIPTSLPANGGNAATVNNHTVETNVPADAVFTDTIYDDTEVKESIDELNSNLDTLEFGEVAGGKNLADLGDVVLESAGMIYSKVPVRLPIGTYTLSWYTTNTSGELDFGLLTANDTSVYFKNNIPVINGSLTFTISDDAVLINLFSHSAITIKNVQIEEGTTATAYEPYIPSVKMLAEEVGKLNESLSVIGKCKNLLNPKLEITTLNGVTCTDNGDGTYTLNGTATEYCSFGIDRTHDISTLVEGKTYKLVGTDIKNANYTQVIIYERAIQKMYHDNGEGVSFVYNTENQPEVVIQVLKDSTINNVVIKPMIVDAELYPDVTYDDFVPYTGDGETLTHDVAEIKKDLGSLTFSASGTTLTITDGTNTWTLGANS